MTTDSSAMPDAGSGETLHISGQCRLEGEIEVSGAKNAALPIMAASLLCEDALTISNLPNLGDVALMNQVLASLGVERTMTTTDTFKLDARSVVSCAIPVEQARQMRASILVLGPLLARYGEAQVPYPGGCSIGPRPVDQHLDGLRALGAVFEEREDIIAARAPDGLRGAEIKFRQPTVCGTENIMIAASLAKGNTVVHNAAREPEVADLAHCLNTLGAKIEGIGTDTLLIQGVPRLQGGEYRIIPDRIEASTYLVAVAATRGRVQLCKACPENMESVLDKLRAAGAQIKIGEESIELDMDGKRPQAVDVCTAPYPGFPTDMQAQFTAINALASGKSCVTETIFNDRMAHVKDMQRMGAQIKQGDGSVLVTGVEHLQGSMVRANDLRASASLVIAGLMAEGETIVQDIEHIDRGYQWIEEKLNKLGAQIKRRPR